MRKMTTRDSILIEVCVARVADAIQAEIAGADRIELNSALELDGLTPSIGSVEVTKSAIKIPVIAMLRPHNRRFFYDSQDKASMLRDAHLLLEAGADGLACGALCEENRLDVKFIQQIRQISLGKEFVFHRAFDQLPNFVEGITQLLDLGIDRVLTSGGSACAEQGLEMLSTLCRQFGDRIEILPAGGISHRNAVRIVSATGCRQLHGSFRSQPVPTSSNTQQLVHDFQSLRKTRTLLSSMCDATEQNE